jgi:hypothetical protein
MMASGYRWGSRSLRRLQTCDERLQNLMTAALTDDRCPCDVTVIEGHRSNERQAELYNRGRVTPGPKVTNARPGQSRHNSMPSQAVDVGPCDRSGAVLWDNKALFNRWGAHVEEVARELGISIRWGGRFSFYDGAHFELQEKT